MVVLNFVKFANKTRIVLIVILAVIDQSTISVAYNKFKSKCRAGYIYINSSASS